VEFCQVRRFQQRTVGCVGEGLGNYLKAKALDQGSDSAMLQ
jgi:hypothetical protein